MIEGETYGEEMRRLRLQLGLSQKEVAAFCGVSNESISGWERGRLQGNSPEAAQLPRMVIRKLKRRLQYKRDRERLDATPS